MINLNTPTEDLMWEVREDVPRAIYWYVKTHGGEKKRFAIFDGLMDKAMAKNSMSERNKSITYTSRNGNKWVMYDNVVYYDKVRCYNRQFVLFCYIKTEASFGLFMPIINPANDRDIMGCLSFTPHFFRRFRERLGLSLLTLNTLENFASMIWGKTFTSYGKKRKKLYPDMDLRLPGSIARGVMKSSNPVIVEMRTFLTDRQLQIGQLNQTNKLRKVSDRQCDAPAELMEAVSEGMMERIGYIVEPIVDIARRCGLSEENESDYRRTLTVLYLTFEKYLRDNTLLSRIRMLMTNPGDVNIHLFLLSDRSSTYAWSRAFVDLVIGLAAEAGIRNFSRNKFFDILIYDVLCRKLYSGEDFLRDAGYIK